MSEASGRALAARRPATAVCGFVFALLLCSTAGVDGLPPPRSHSLTPPYFNLAEGRRIRATATCGEGTPEPELYCKLVGANADRDVNVNLIQGQVCDQCDPYSEDKKHPPEFATDGAETWWQSPPLSRGMSYNEVNLTIDLGQEFHVAYVFVKMANSPRPGVWVLERSLDNGITYQPWQYFADTEADCEAYFGRESLQPITRDDSVKCETQYSKVVPLEGGEIVVSLLNNRPSANDFFNSTILQEWTRATNIQLRFLRTKTLLGHLMSVARQDPTVTRRYFYSIKDISIGGRCVCNGHADTCDITNPNDPYKLVCQCQHHTCGDNCDSCCPGYEQKAWRQSKANLPFVCEPCNCFGHSNECEYDAETDAQHLSLDIHGNYEGGGVCKNCRHNTEGINCNRCKPGFFRPFGKLWNDTEVCQECDCKNYYSTGNCAEETGQCECRKEYAPPDCKTCSFGYFGYPECRPCECHVNGTQGFHCEPEDGGCPCKPNYAGKYCNECEEGYYNFPHCLDCQCNPQGSTSNTCDTKSGQCPCSNKYGGRTCDICQNGYAIYPNCEYCNCDVRGTLPDICDKETAQCLCKVGYDGERCDRCTPGYYGYPNCKPCNCSEVGSGTTSCDASGKCSCLPNFSGRACNQCSPGYYQYPLCLPCLCDPHGSIGVSCDNEGKCSCKSNFDGIRCDQCKEGFYNFPACEDCNCDPAGVLDTFQGCGSVPAGELCQCKERVQGRICNDCKPLFWNLQTTNPQGCEECDCHVPGVVGGMGVCDSKTGQCICKPSVTSRRCNECESGTFNLEENNLFGCSDCGCDVGGSVHNVCDKNNGQCTCRPRITGRTCKEPLQLHYFPTLHHYQYEAEDGRTPTSNLVRYGFDERIFRGYSWKGYAVFSQLQDEIIHDIYINKPSLYRMIFRYINPQNENVQGDITITPDNPNEIEQNFKVIFRPTNKTASFIAAVGEDGVSPAALVMNPGRWSISLKNKKSLLLDYFVLLPSAFYEATILVEEVDKPCEVGNNNLCRHFSYPSLEQFDTVKGEGGFLSDGEFRNSLHTYFEDDEHLRELDKNSIPMINDEQNEINFELAISRPGPHVLLITYITPFGDQQISTLNIETSSQKKREKGRVTLYACPYTDLCRQAVTDRHGEVAIFDFDSNVISLTLMAEDGSNIALDSIVAIPFEEWSMDYQQPKPACVRKDGVSCLQATFPVPPDSKKVEFESNNEIPVAKHLPGISNNKTILVYLDANDPMIDVSGKVPSPGLYLFVVHYYQPNYPAFEMDAIIHNGQYYTASVEIDHCPSNSGCRSVVKQTNGVVSPYFQLTENFVFTLKEKNQKGVWLDYLLVIPIDQYSDKVLSEDPVDHTGLFITQCGQNHFHMDSNTRGFCRDAVFSLTSDYNDGALPCQCDFQGSQSFYCETFGGQCPCKPNVIGRKCEACRTGYFGFPHCKPCSCPSTAVCNPYTGECICPTKVYGERCDKCMPYTYGFDPIIGCEECNCNNLGVELITENNGDIHPNLQCNLTTGSCRCKENVVGRICDSCQVGHWGFPHCTECECDLRGTMHEICDQRTAECYCKSNVHGQACDLCKEGTFNLQSQNVQGCTKCFCSGKTSRCSSSSLYRAQISTLENWALTAIDVGKTINIEYLQSHFAPTQYANAISAFLSHPDIEGKAIYFQAPLDYLGNKLTSYGGLLNYSIFYTAHDGGGDALYEPDIILQSGELFLLHSSLEQPAEGTLFEASVILVESNFYLPNKQQATREHIMQVLTKLDGIYIKANYHKFSSTSQLEDITLDIAVENYNPNSMKAMAVEQCQCPPNYQGLSCEECAPGYYRTQTGPFGGFCVPCQCNGHSDRCDPITGICFDCKNNTVGDHCEQCAVGHYGNATHGTQVDCMICACPLPIPSNNFARSCEVSPDGERISCDCIPGYYGARCEVCAAGYFGTPDIPGEYCQECQCSGNIDQADPGACDSITGECLRCLNNTYGESCNLCAPGFFGDAVTLKDCQNCACDKCGTRHCDSYHGVCECHENVIGEKCDRCEFEHYGFSSCQGCSPCNCDIASESSQCDDNTGKCRCRPGVTGRTCDSCIPGYWSYSAAGCVSCGCNEEYSVGVGCNATTGQCHCLPGVIGEKCDHCPHRWVLIENEGCIQCDSCTHNLLDVTDRLRAHTLPIYEEFKTVALGYFTTQRLVYINRTVQRLSPQIQVDPERINLKPLAHEVESLEMDTRSLYKKANYSVDNAEVWAPKADKVKKDALYIEELIIDAVDKANMVVYEVNLLSENLEGRAGPQVEFALQEAQGILYNIQQVKFDHQNEEAHAELRKAMDQLKQMRDFSFPVQNQSEAFNLLRKKIHNFDDKLEDMHNQTVHAQHITHNAQNLNEQNRNLKVISKIEAGNNISKAVNNAIEEGDELIANATELLLNAKQNFEEIENVLIDINDKIDTLEEQINSNKDELEDLDELRESAMKHAENLTKRAENLDGMLAESRFTTKDAVDAANAYKNIVETVNQALKAASDSKGPAENATFMSEGLETRTRESKERSSTLFMKVQDTLNQAREELHPKLAEAKLLVKKVDALNVESSDKDTQINEELKKLGNEDDSGTRRAMENAQHAEDMAKDASNQIVAIADRLPQDVSQSKRLHIVAQDANNLIEQARQKLIKLDNVVPNINALMGNVKEKQKDMNSSGVNFSHKLEDLQKKIAQARELTNRIKVGVTFYRNTTLSLEKPKDLSSLGTSTKISLYFKTKEPQGFLFYLGNHKEDSLSTKAKRSIQIDDFIALEIENGYPVLIVDLGAGPHKIIVDKRVDDDVWYQAVVERTGRIVKLTIYEEGSNGQQIAHSNKDIIPGAKYVLNLDQEHSKLYVGGYDQSFDISSEIKTSSFVGEIEELVIGDSHISLWNFRDGENNDHGAIERDKLVNLQPSTGYRFNGDNCYVIVDGQNYQIRTQTDVVLKFKTYAKDGLMFLVGKDNSFFSIELVNGHVKYQFNLGHGPVSLLSNEKFNDGKWHKVQAVRDRQVGILMVDDTQQSSDKAVGANSELRTLPKLYFGGHPKHRFKQVTKAFFDGCIDEVQINGIVVDLSQNIQAFGVTPGCPVQVATIMSFDERSQGYLHWPNVSTNDTLEFNFKFKTEAENGLLLYLTDRPKRNTLSLSLVEGKLLLSSQMLQLSTQSMRYNDSQWHVVTAIYDSTGLTLDIDDIYPFKKTGSLPPLHIAFGSIYFGGVPDHHHHLVTGTTTSFVGCIGDATVNGTLINFANTTDRVGVKLGKCPLKDHEPAYIGPLPPDLTTDVDHEIVTATEEQPVTSKENDIIHIVPTVFTSIDSTTSSTTTTTTSTTTTTTTTTVSPTTTTTATTTTTWFPNTTTTSTTTIPSETSEGCFLPLYPADDTDASLEKSLRFGTEPNSWAEYNTIFRLKTKYEISIAFKTYAESGIILYVADDKHIDFISLYVKDAKLMYGFNCGTGAALIPSEKKYNDGKWHVAILKRSHNEGTLIIEDENMVQEETLKGESTGDAKTVNVEAPFFLGGLRRNMNFKSKENMKGTNTSFVGCLKNLIVNSQPAGVPAIINGVTPCSDKTEEGSFFSADGGYMKVQNNFRVGEEMNIEMYIKPRNISGILLSVHGKRDFLLLQMIDGNIKFTVDNGKGIISTNFQPRHPHYFCDGNWHEIQAIKTGNVVTLSVDKVGTTPGIGKPGQLSTDTRNALFIGGHAPTNKKLRGVVRDRMQYVGCIKNVVINNVLQTFTVSQAHGNVTIDFCPII